MLHLNAVHPLNPQISHPDFQNLSTSPAAKDGIERRNEGGDGRPSEGRAEGGYDQGIIMEPAAATKAGRHPPGTANTPSQPLVLWTMGTDC